MEVGNQPLPISARLDSTPSPTRHQPPNAEPGEARLAGDRVEIRSEASQLSAAIRAGSPAAMTGAQVQELVARTNREASRTANQASLERLIALVR